MLTACFIASPALSQTPAFPGALGFGANATGGRGGTVYRVTTLANSGPGSFRDAASQPNRIIIFDVSGYITISSELALNDNLTIAGQTAPGGGIGITGNEVSCGASTNIIIRHVRFRPGSAAPQGSAHCLNMFASTNIILDHVSFEFGPWNNIGGVNCDRVTIQNCLVANPINQQFGAHIERVGGSCAFLYNIWANGHNRQPLASINTIYINNTVYNYQAGFTTHTSGFFSYDLLNNYFITGPATTSPGNDFFQVDSHQSVYSSGNLRDSDNNGALGGSPTTPGGVVVLGTPWSPVTATIPAYSPAASFRINVSTAGAWPRDAVDDLVASQVKRLGSGPTGTGAGTAGPGGGLYSGQSQTGLPNGGLGILAGGGSPLDTDLDGMPDYWEVATGSAPNINDSMNIGAGGYALIEHYLNWLAEPHASTSTNSPVDVELWNYTSGFTNAAPVYSVHNASNGVVTLLANGHTARFTPDPDFSGLGSFRFSVAGNDGTAYTNTVTIVVSSLPQPKDLIWAGDGIANVWDAGTATNWLDTGVPAAFASGDNVTFNDSGLNAPAITLTGALSAGEVLVSASQDYTFAGSGSLVGPTTLVKEGPGKLTINTVNTFTGGTTINEGVLQLGDGVSANGSLSGNVTNQTTLIFDNPSAVSSAASIRGSGTLIKRGAGTLTLSGVQSYTNLTTIEAGTLEFTGTPPPGVISNNSTLTFRPAGALTHAGTITGPGRVNTSSGSITVTLSGTNTFSGGLTVTAGNLLLANSRAAGTGPVTNTSSGLIYVGNGAVITNDFTLTTSTTDLNMRCDNGTGVWAGNVVNLGGGASWRPGSDGGTLIFTGTAHQGTRNFIVPRGSVHFASNAVVTATGSATALGRDTSGGNRSLNLTIRDNASLTLGPCSIGGGQSGNNVTVTLQNNALLSMATNSLNLHNITRSTSVSTLRLNGGTLAVAGFTKSQTHTNVINFNGGLLKATTNNATFPGPGFLGSFFNQTANVQAGGARIDTGGFNILIPQALIHDAALGSVPDGGLTKLGAGTLTLTGTNTYTGGTIVSNGTLTVLATGSISNTAFIRIAAGAVLNIGNVAGANFTVRNRTVISGDGSVLGTIKIGPAGTLAPGTSIGRMTFSNSLLLLSGSTNIFEISKAPFTNDVAKASSVTYGGELIVTNVGPDTLAAGDSFRLFDSSFHTGSFSKIVLPPLGPGLAWNTSLLNTNGTISVAAIAPPSINAVSAANGNFIFSGAGGIPGANYFVLGSTNVALPLTQWQRLFTNQFGPGGAFSVTNPINPASPASFYLLQLP